MEVSAFTDLAVLKIRIHPLAKLILEVTVGVAESDGCSAHSSFKIIPQISLQKGHEGLKKGSSA